MTKFSLITFHCEHCGIEVKVYSRRGAMTFSVNDKLFSKADVLSYHGFYVCIQCRELHTLINFREVEL